MGKNFVHPTAILDAGAQLGQGVQIWHFCHIRGSAELGDLTSLGRDVYIDQNVKLGRGTRVQNGVSLYQGVEVAEWCFIGPHVIFTNDLYPRAGKRSWNIVPTRLETGMSIGAGAVVICGVKIGTFAMVGAGAIVTKDVAPFTLVMGFPAEATARICACGETHWPLPTPLLARDLVRSCCERNLAPEPLELARQRAMDHAP